MSKKNKPRIRLFDKTVWADEVVTGAYRLGDAINARMSEFFARYGLTVLQFNVMRILYVQDEDGEGIPAGSISQWLFMRGPDVTRIVDRLENIGMVERLRYSKDRRVVRVRLTQAGTDLVENIQAPLIKHNVEMLAEITEKDLKKTANRIGRVLEVLVDN